MEPICSKAQAGVTLLEVENKMNTYLLLCCVLQFQPEAQTFSMCRLTFRRPSKLSKVETVGHVYRRRGNEFFMYTHLTKCVNTNLWEGKIETKQFLLLLIMYHGQCVDTLIYAKNSKLKKKLFFKVYMRYWTKKFKFIQYIDLYFF